MGTDLVIATRKEIVALNPESPQVDALMFNLKAAGGVSDGDLIKVKNPSGGATVFAVEVSGQPTRYLPSLEGILLCILDRRTLWANKGVGSGELPVCSSNDMVHGKLRTSEDGELDIPEQLVQIAMPGGDNGECAGCYFNEWDSAVDEAGRPTKGKRCQESRILYFLPTNEVLPYKLTVPTGSIKEFGQAISRLPVRYDRAVIKLSLVAEKNKAGKPYAKYVASLVSALDADAVAQLAEYGKILERAIKSATADRSAEPRKGRRDEIPEDERFDE